MSTPSPAGHRADPVARPAGAPLLAVRDLSVRFAAIPVVHGVTFDVAAGEVLAVVGESGSGKTVTALSLLGLLPAGAGVSGQALLDGDDLLRLTPPQRRAVRGNDVAMVFQEPMNALNPVFTCGYQVAEAVRAHRGRGRRPLSRRGRAAAPGSARERTLDLFALVGLADPVRVSRSYPHELSGGQLQRVVIAMAIANDPRLLIADEPTTALDVTVQAEVLELLRDLRARSGMAILLITHDLGVVADLADRVLVMHDGRVVEQSTVTELFAAPRADHTRELLGAVVSLGAEATRGAQRALELSAEATRGGGEHVAAGPRSAMSVAAIEGPAVVRVRAVSVVYKRRFRAPAVAAVDGVSLHVAPGEVLGLVGESGSGKSTLAALMTGLLAPAAGTVELLGADLAELGGPALRAVRRRIGVVFQDPVSSLNPRSTVGASVAEPIELHRALSGARERAARVAELLEAVELPANFRSRYPHELSGGQRQRVALARALALDPELLFADEPTSALDVSVQAKVLALFHRLQAERGFAAVFISHDLAVIEQVAGRVAVMHRGHVVELGPTAKVLTGPLHPYTARLLAAAPVADPQEQRRRREVWRALHRTPAPWA